LTNNNSNNKQKETVVVDKKAGGREYYELNPRFKKENQVFLDNPIYFLYDYTEDGRQVRNSNPTKKPWPYPKPTEQYRYEKFISEITDPSTGKFHTPRDNDGQKLELPYNKPPAGYIITDIIRIRTSSNGKQYLTTLGTFYGHSGTGTPIFCPAHQPEKWTRTLFSMEREYDSQTKSFYNVNKGPRGIKTEYDLEFNTKNLDMLLKNTTGFNNNIPSELFPLDESRFRNNANFYVKEESRGGTGILVNAFKIFSIEETVRLFKQRSFNDLYHGSYYPKAIIEERMLRNMAGSSSSSTTSDGSSSNSSSSSNNNNNNSYTMTPNYGTAKGLLEENINQEGVQTYHQKNTGYIG
jgi:hypothetical protein